MSDKAMKDNSAKKKLQRKIRNLRKQLWTALKNKKATLNLPKKEWDQKMKAIIRNGGEIITEAQRTGKEKLKRKIGNLKETLSEIEKLIDGEMSPEDRKKIFIKLIQLFVSVMAFWFFF